jgi:prevent-host-death family protein
MKHPALAQDLVPVNELRANLSDWIHRVGETGRPVVVTQRGKAAAVLVTPQMLDELDEEREVVRRVLQGLREVSAGEVVEDEEVWGELEAMIDREERSREDTME